MEATLTPPAFRAAIAAAREAGESAFLEIAEKSPSLTDLAQFDRPEPFVPDVLSPEVTLYRGAPDPDGRRVLVVFTGRGHGVTVPLACFLQRLPAAQWDVLVLCDHRLTHFRDGCLGMGASFPELAATVLRLARPYRSAAALGMSMGGMAAIQLALLAPGLPAVAIGARRPSDVSRLFSDAAPPPAFEPVCACLPRTARDALLFVYATDHDVDRVEAEEAAALSGGRLLGVPYSGRHAILADIWLKGDLAAFLRVALSERPLSPNALRASLGIARPPSPPLSPARLAAAVHRRAKRGAGHLSRLLGRKPA